ncbi:MAG: tungsten-containing formylmethanofuran dehydrogenase, subunit, partial [Enterovirga sp.]|nr:tungsten-containing formylmethanofuran dehydrogenase, subunit [Enterovirga sp.]
MAAWIDGMSVDEATAFASAADLLAQARLPAIAGLVADVDAIRAGIRLAEAIGGMVDPLGAPELYAALGGLVSAGQMATTPTEAVCRADLVVAVGEAAARSPLLHRLAASSPVHGSTAGTAREIMVLGGSPPEAIAHKACPL